MICLEDLRKPILIASAAAAVAVGGVAYGGAGAADFSPERCNTDDVVRILERQTDILTEILISVKIAESTN